jgi:hypothetical protein
MKTLNNYLNETSISAKKRNKKFAKSLLIKGKRIGNIKSFGIITAENPDGIKQSNQENKKSMDTLKKFLKDGHYIWLPVEGHYGSKENSLMIFNITNGVLQNIAKKFEQESYIYATLEKDGEFPNFDYWEKKITGKPANAAKNPYTKKDESIKWVEIPDAEDYYTVIGKDFKFNINFSIFEELNDKLEQNIQEVAKEREIFLSHDEILERSIAGGFRNQYIRKYVNQV